jgi:imidazolonepropionase-like amidohydrolase
MAKSRQNRCAPGIGLQRPACKAHRTPAPIVNDRSAQRPALKIFQNVRIFDGKSRALSGPRNVLVQTNTIEKISPDRIETEPESDVRVFDGRGRTLMPGLIDAHWHATMAAVPLQTVLLAPFGYTMIAAGREAGATLLRGFTSVRDLAGPAFGLKMAIDAGLITGPRIWPSGAMISQTGGHGDFRLPYEVPRAQGAPLTRGEALGGGAIADGPDEVRLRAREQLMLGSSQLKLAAGGGVASMYDPIDVSQYTEAEFHAAVEAAENWGTYVTVHAYTPHAIQTALRAGVRCIDHGHLMDEETAKMIADKDAWLSLQPFVDDGYTAPQTGKNLEKLRQVFAGTDSAYGFAKKYRLKTAFGTDMLFEPALTQYQNAKLVTLRRWYEPAEILAMATGTNAELLALSGPRNPYPGKLGVVEEGALADLLLVNGDPIADLDLIKDPQTNFSVIMKDGTIYKDE